MAIASFGFDIVSALSITNVAASASSAQASAPTDTPDAAGDASPFAMLLAAIAAADPDLQVAAQAGVIPSAPAADAEISPSSTPITADSDDTDATEAPAAIATDATPARSIPGDPGAPKIIGKPDKKAATDKIAANDTANPLMPQPQMPILPQLPIPPMAQAAVQIQTVASNDEDGDDTVAALTAPNVASAPVQSGAVPGAAQTIPDLAPSASPRPPETDGKQNPVLPAAQPLMAANDDGDEDAAAPSEAVAALQTGLTTETAGVKFTQARGPLNKTAIQAAPVAPAPDVEDVASDVDIAATPAVATNAPPDTGAQKPAPEKTDKPVPSITAGVELPQTAATDTSSKSGTAATLATTDDASAGKPARVAASSTPQSQTDISQPLPHAAAGALPQLPVTIDAGGVNPAGGSNLSVRVAIHTPDSQTANSPMVTPDTDGLAISIAARSLSGAKQFDIRLDPPELGRVEVRLSIDASGKTQAHMTTDQPQTLELLQKDAPNLTRALRDAGLDVSQSGLNFSLKGQGQQQGQNQNGAFGTPARSLSLLAAAQTVESVPPAGSLSLLLGNARLDIHV